MYAHIRYLIYLYLTSFNYLLNIQLNNRYILWCHKCIANLSNQQSWQGWSAFNGQLTTLSSDCGNQGLLRPTQQCYGLAVLWDGLVTCDVLLRQSLSNLSLKQCYINFFFFSPLQIQIQLNDILSLKHEFGNLASFKTKTLKCISPVISPVLRQLITR